MLSASAASSSLITLAINGCAGAVYLPQICKQLGNSDSSSFGRSYFQINVFKNLTCPSPCTQQNEIKDRGFMFPAT